MPVIFPIGLLRRRRIEEEEETKEAENTLSKTSLEETSV